MDQFQQYTCIRFREKTNEDKDYVRLFKGRGYELSVIFMIKILNK